MNCSRLAQSSGLLWIKWDWKCQLLQQTGKGKGDAVRLGFDKARGDVLMILDADLTVAHILSHPLA